MDRWMSGPYFCVGAQRPSPHHKDWDMLTKEPNVTWIASGGSYSGNGKGWVGEVAYGPTLEEALGAMARRKPGQEMYWAWERGSKQRCTYKGNALPPLPSKKIPPVGAGQPRVVRRTPPKVAKLNLSC